ncbi:MAG: HAD family hydrolase [Candidatus Marinimicrobia bacterium]|jgi:D-glycero-D-manno-heptose 1,7-bisphosphate phosphatase|nr:HAD family hydrolase [Candidatus Neomarinimicrobiota bacterium]MDC1165446.1 HAD family hydrolase [Candidatus Thioglobus sp.]
MNRALFLDRDGVINIDKGHVHKVEDFEFCNGIFDLCRYFAEENFVIVVITNQAGIAKNFYKTSDFYKLDKWMVEQFEEYGVDILRTYFCPHHPDFTGKCKCRKPNPGMLLNASKDLNIDLSRSIFIGNKESDIEAGIRAGIPSNILFTSQDVETKATMVLSHLNELKMELLKL